MFPSICQIPVVGSKTSTLSRRPSVPQPPQTKIFPSNMMAAARDRAVFSLSDRVFHMLSPGWLALMSNSYTLSEGLLS